MSLNAHWATIIQNYTRPGSNWRPSACEADVIATRPRVLVTICQKTLIWFGTHFFLSEGMSLCFWAFRRAFFLRVGACAGQRAHDRDPTAKCAQGSGTRSPETIGKMRFSRSQPSPPTFSLQGTGWAGRLTYMIGISRHFCENRQDLTASTRGLVAMTSA